MKLTRLNKSNVAAVLLSVILIGESSIANAEQAQVVAPSRVVETYSDWVVQCIATDEDTASRVCEITQELREQKSGQRILAAFLRPVIEGNKDSASLTVIAPFGLQLSAGLRLSITEDVPLFNMGFQTCLPAGCIAIKDIGSEQVEALKAGKMAVVSVVDMGGQNININLSLTGFTAAWKRLKSL